MVMVLIMFWGIGNGKVNGNGINIIMFWGNGNGSDYGKSNGVNYGKHHGNNKSNGNCKERYWD